MDDSATLSIGRARKYHEGWTQHQAEGDKNWNDFWLVLRGSMLFIFHSDATNRKEDKKNKPQSKKGVRESDVMIGTLTINAETESRTVPGDSKKKGFRMELVTTSAKGARQVNRFKFASQNDRDLWKSFIVGISQGIIPSDVHLLPGQLKNVHEAMAEVRDTPPPLPSIPRPNTLLPRPKVQQPDHAASVRSNGSNHSSDSGSFQSHVTSPQKSYRSMSVPSEAEDVTNLRQLMRRQSDLAFKSLDTGPATFSNNLEVHEEAPQSPQGFSRENSAPGGFATTGPGFSRENSAVATSGFATTARAYHSPKKGNEPPPPPSTHTTHTLGGLNRRKSIDAPPRNDFTPRTPPNAEPFVLPPNGHLFFTNNRSAEAPSWFFENCSRDQAEGVLTVGRQYGNVLMRPSSTHKDTGKYVISMRREVSGGTQLNHYSIAVTTSGFKIDVDNKHPPMRCLSDVMDFFVSVAGYGTRTMTCNDVARIYGKQDSTISGNAGFTHPSWLKQEQPSSPQQNTLTTQGHVSGNIRNAVQEMNNSRNGIGSANNSFMQAPSRLPAVPSSYEQHNPSEYYNSREQESYGNIPDDGPPDGAPSQPLPGYVSMNGAREEAAARKPSHSHANTLPHIAEENNNRTGKYFRNPTLNKPVPVRSVPSDTLRKQSEVSSMTHGFSTIQIGHGADIPTPAPPPPPPIETIPTTPHPPAPPPPAFTPAAPAPPPFPPASPAAPTPPAFNQTPALQPPQTPTTPTFSPQRRFSEGNHSIRAPAPLSFEEELAKRLRPQREQIYADATILTSN